MAKYYKVKHPFFMTDEHGKRVKVETNARIELSKRKAARYLSAGLVEETSILSAKSRR